MSFYIVPAIAYQTQQKMKKKTKDDKKKHKKKHHDAKAESSSSTNISLRTSSIYEESLDKEVQPKSREEATRPPEEPEAQGSISEELTRKLHKLKRSESSNSLASNIAAKFTTTSTPERSSGGDYFDQRHSSTATTASGLSKHRQRRNSALSAHSSRHEVQADMDSAASPRLFKPSFTMAQDKVKEFVTIQDLELMNSPEAMKKTLFTPSFQVFRYNNFLDILCGQHSNDPVNFASIRYNSILKFIQRYKVFIKMRESKTVATTDMRDIEGLLAHDLLECRAFLAKLLNLQSRQDESRSSITWCEELLELNFTNYVRFVLNLPTSVLAIPKENLDEVAATHVHFKAIFTDLEKQVHLLKKEDSGDDYTNNKNSVAFLLQSVTKVSYDFILLEKYHINILTKLGGNSLIDSRLVANLFEQFMDNRRVHNTEAIKVLVYNVYFSVHYSWYMAITIPFLRVVEMNAFAENPKLVGDYAAYTERQLDTPKTSYIAADAKLYDDYFSRIQMESYSKFKSLSDDQFVAIQRESEQHHGTVMELTAHKPPNFEFNSNSLATIADETFDVVQTRDLVIQLNKDNCHTVLAEFHRVLKKGGVFEFPLILAGVGNLGPIDKPQIIGLPEFSALNKVDSTERHAVIPKFYELILTELVGLFGENNVKFSVVLLNTVNEVNGFLAKDIGLRLAEIGGRIKEYCRNFEVQEDGRVDPDTHLYMPIRAEKV